MTLLELNIKILKNMEELKMKYDKNNLNIAYIGGGSRGWAWNLMKDLAVDEEISGTVRLYDIDMDAAKANEK